MTSPVATLDVPEEVSRKLKHWNYPIWWWTGVYYLMGIGSIVLSGIAASNASGAHVGVYSGLAGICTAVLTFANPTEKYHRFVSARNILEIAALRYRYGRISLDDLLAAVEKAENAITPSQSGEPQHVPAAPPRQGVEAAEKKQELAPAQEK